MKKFLLLFFCLFFMCIKGHSATPDYQIIGPTIIHTGDQDTYTITPPDGINYTWTVTGGEIVSGQGTPSVIVLWTTDGPHDIQIAIDTGLNGIVVIDDDSM